MDINDITHQTTINKSLTKMFNLAKSGSFSIKEIYLLNLIYTLYDREVDIRKKACLKEQYFTILNRYPRIICKVNYISILPENKDVPVRDEEITDTNIFIYSIMRIGDIADLQPEFLEDKDNYSLIDASNEINHIFTTFGRICITLNSNLLLPNKTVAIYDDLGNNITSAFELVVINNFNNYISFNYYAPSTIPLTIIIT